LIPFQISPDNEAGKEAVQSEALSIIAKEIEKELSGRIMLLPSYHYVKSADKDNETARLNDLVKEVEKQPFTHKFRSEEHTSELQSRFDIVCRLLLEKKKEN